MKKRIRLFALGAMMSAPFTMIAGAALADGDAAKGQQVFQQCAACHSIESGVTLMGPSLAGIVGREAGSVAGFNYSDVMAKASFEWSEEKLDAYIADPGGEVPGNRMPFGGMRGDQDRADVVAYLKTLSN